MRVLALFAFVLAISGPALADWMHPHYSFRCRESGGIDVFGIHDGSIVTFLNGTCEDNTTSPKGGLIDIPYSCTNETNEGTKPAYEVFISVKDPMFGETTKRSTTTIIHIVNNTQTPNSSSIMNTATVTSESTDDTTTEAAIIGGHKEHKFIIRCLSIPSGGVNKTVAHVFQGGPHELPENYKEVFPVEMHFKATENIDAPDISEIYIGDEFFMFLKYTGASQYTVIPKKCTAYGGTEVNVDEGGQPVNEKRVDLWDQEKKNTSCTVHKELLENIDKYKNNQTVIAAKMYGFRFEESEYITIVCEVGVFPENYKQGICPTSRRRKRDTGLTRRDVVETAIQRKNIVAKLRVIDYPSEYGNKGSKTGGSCEWIKFSFGVMILSSLFSVNK